jgi:uncharacterized integral membrane protein
LVRKRPLAETVFLPAALDIERQGLVMRAIAFLFLLVVIGVLVVLGVQNHESVALTFLNWSVAADLWVVVGAGYLLGMLSGWAVVGMMKRSWQRVVEPGRRDPACVR